MNNKTNKTKKQVIVIEKKTMTITQDMFDKEATPLRSREEAEKIAKQYPVYISIRRNVSPSGNYNRSISVYTTIYYLPSQYKRGEVSFITPLLITSGGTKQDHAQNSFDSVEKAEEWVRKKVENITENRQKLVEKIKQEKNEEYEGIIVC